MPAPSNQNPVRVELDTDGAKQLAAELRRVANQLDIWAEQVVETGRLDVYEWRSLSDALQVHVHIGKAG